MLPSAASRVGPLWAATAARGNRGCADLLEVPAVPDFIFVTKP